MKDDKRSVPQGKLGSVALACSIVLAMLLFKPVHAQGQKRTPVIAIEGTRFTLDEKPFDFAGISFFNALYNPTFNSDEQTRLQWLNKFNTYGISVLRIWGEWNNTLGFIDTCDSCIVYDRNGILHQLYVDRLKELLDAAASLDMVV